MSSLATRVLDALTSSGKRQTELAVACKVRPPSVNDWLSGKTKSMKAATAHRAAAFLGVNFLWLTEGRGPMRGGEPDLLQQPEGIATCDDLLKSYLSMSPLEQAKFKGALRYIETGSVADPNEKKRIGTRSA